KIGSMRRGGRTIWLVAIFLAAGVCLAPATDFFWTNQLSGDFTNAANWVTNGLGIAAFPVDADNANFTNTSTKPVSWTTGLTNANAYFNSMNGVVTQAIGSSTWFITNQYVLGQTSGQTATVVHTTGTLIVTNGAHTGKLIVGQPGVGTYTLKGGTL